ncbi:integral membrane protein GPR137B-like [Myotis lucifugus]|uniref:integral membrane protein GPR137B-like n=1 Tax=Myotis lucifugus TaxID=59463 RepID=UPI0006D71297|nr:integral membrane protein GPR137B-like [Myotis lucifugus]
MRDAQFLKSERAVRFGCRGREKEKDGPFAADLGALSVCPISLAPGCTPSLPPQADLKNQLGDGGYVVFGVVLFVWELLPTSLVVYFFRVRNPAKDLTSPGLVPSHGFSPRSYFFDNPRRYDSDDDLAWNVAPQGLHGSFAPDYYDWGQQTNSFLAPAGTLPPDLVVDPGKPRRG